MHDNVTYILELVPKYRHGGRELTFYTAHLVDRQRHKGTYMLRVQHQRQTVDLGFDRQRWLQSVVLHSDGFIHIDSVQTSYIRFGLGR